MPPIWLEPGESAPISYLLVCYNKYIDTGTASGNKVGNVYSKFRFYGYDDGKEVCASNTVDLEWDVIDDEAPTDWLPPTEANAMIVKSVISSSVDPNGYQLGETVEYGFLITNTGAETLTDLKVYDPLLINPEPLSTIASLAPGEAVTVHGAKLVTLEDVQHHGIENVAKLTWGSEEDGTFGSRISNTVWVNVIHKEGLLFTKQVVSTPANGLYFVEGEEVVFELSVVNNGQSHYRELIVYDTPILDGTPVTTIEDVAPGYSGTFEVHYVVTEADAALGYFVNIAWAIGENEAEIPEYFYTNEVEISTGMDACGVIWDLAVVKAETSTPKNGSYYEEGETISYTITATNTGEVPIVEGYMFDFLKVGNFGEIGAFENLMPGDSREFHFDYVVTKADVDTGNVMNCAYSYWTIDNDEDQNYYASDSNKVWSKTGEGGIDHLIPPVWFEENPLLIPPVTWTGDNGGVGEESCIRTLTAKGEMAETYTLHLCGAHQKVEDEVAALLAEAETKNEAAIVEAWTQAKALWTVELDALYDVAYQNANVTARAAVLADRNAFYAYLDAYADLLGDADPILTAKKVAALVKDRCADLCYDLHHTGETRAESVFVPHEAITETMDYPKCVTAPLEAEKDFAYAEILCTDHAASEKGVPALLNGAASPTAKAAAWKRVQKLRQTDLDKLVNAAYKAASADGKAVIAKWRIAFDHMAAARGTLLSAFYGQDTAMEMIAKLYAEQRTIACKLWK